jgi:hypothetical protein
MTAGREAIENKEIRFRTGDAPNYIPLENILYCYPIVEQQYFLTNESTGGFVQLRTGQEYLFQLGFDYRLLFVAGNNQAVPTNFTYNAAARRLNFDIPQLANRQRYTLMLVYTPRDVEGVGGSAQTKHLLSDGEDGTLTVEQRGAFAAINATEESILDYRFTTSRFSTFGDKIGSINTEGRGVAQNAGVSFRFLFDVVADEAFDEAEVAGTMHSGGRALIRPYAELREPFFTEAINPVVYNGYPFGNGRIRLTHRDDAVIGVPPVRSVFVYQPYLNLIADGARPQRFRFPFSFEAGIIVEQDFRNLQHLIANSNSVSADILHRFLTNRLPFIQHGRYRVIMQYVLPDGTVTSSTEFYFNNFLLFNE